MTREDAIKHLENMKWLLGVNNTTVDDIPLTKVIDDIAALLEAQEPRVMTAQEVINHIGPIYFEVDDDEELNGWVLFRGAVPACSTKVKMVMQSRNQYCMMNDYGKNWRCWTARPNREQRKAVKWDASTHKEP